MAAEPASTRNLHLKEAAVGLRNFGTKQKKCPPDVARGDLALLAIAGAALGGRTTVGDGETLAGGPDLWRDEGFLGWP